MKKSFIRKGFTLVELLIVIVVIGILSAMMMLSSTEATISAKATNVINCLVTLRTAAFQWYVDHVDCVESDGRVKYNGKGPSPIQEFSASQLNLQRYLGHGKITLAEGVYTSLPPGTYGIFDAGHRQDYTDKKGDNNYDRTTWYVGYCFTEPEKLTVRERLRPRLKSLNMHFAGKYPSLPAAEGEETTVWLKVKGRWSPSQWPQS